MDDENSLEPMSGLSEDGKAKGADISKESDRVRQRSIPPPGTGQKIFKIDPLLSGYCEHLDYR